MADSVVPVKDSDGTEIDFRTWTDAAAPTVHMSQTVLRNNGAVVSDSNPNPVQQAQLTPDNDLASVVGKSAVIAVTPTLTTAAYTSGDALGTTQSVANAIRIAGAVATLQSIVITDKSDQKAAIDLIFLDANPSGSTVTDNAALSLVDADLPKVLGLISFVTGDYVTVTGNAVATKSGLGLPFKLASGTTLFLVLLVRGTPTYATDSLQVRVGIYQD